MSIISQKNWNKDAHPRETKLFFKIYFYYMPIMRPALN